MKEYILGLEIKKMSLLLKREAKAYIASGLNSSLTSPQTDIILFIKKSSKDVYQKDIEKNFDLVRSSVSLSLTKLEKAQLVRRIDVPGDARLKKIVLTEKAIELATSIQKLLREYEEIVTCGVTSDEIKTLQKVFDKIRNNLKGGN